jgi:hypothetical protein
VEDSEQTEQSSGGIGSPEIPPAEQNRNSDGSPSSGKRPIQTKSTEDKK